MTREVFRRIFENVDLEKEIDEKYANKNNFMVGRRRPDNIDAIKEAKLVQPRRVARPEIQGPGIFP